MGRRPGKNAESDGFQPVAAAGETSNLSQVCQNIWLALRTRLRGGGCRVLGPDAGLATVGDAVRDPDALVSCAAFTGAAQLVPDVVVVLEVVSPGSARADLVDKMCEYHAVLSIRRYVVIQYRSAGLTVLSRACGTADWTANALAADEALDIPEPGISLPVQELYRGVDLPDVPPAAEA